MRALEEVAYVRFASVYRQFRDVTEFGEEVQALLRNENANGGPVAPAVEKDKKEDTE